MADLIDDMRKVMSDPQHHLNCMQVAPYGDGRAAVLFETGTIDHAIAYSLIWQTTDFTPETTTRLLLVDDWLVSLTGGLPQGLHALEVGRTVWSLSDADWASEKVASAMMNRLWQHQGEIYLFGHKGRCWRKSGSAEWVEIPSSGRSAIMDMHASPTGDVWAVGSNGLFQHLTSSGWVRQDLGLNLDFRGLHVASRNEQRIAGDDGFCARVKDGELIDLDNPGSTFFAVCQFQGVFYWGDSDFGIYKESGDKLEPFFGTDLGYDLRADDKYLYVVGTDRAWRFDGENWRFLRMKYDDGFRIVDTED
jgi:hypothetical protein